MAESIISNWDNNSNDGRDNDIADNDDDNDVDHDDKGGDNDIGYCPRDLCLGSLMDNRSVGIYSGLPKAFVDHSVVTRAPRATSAPFRYAKTVGCKDWLTEREKKSAILYGVHFMMINNLFPSTIL